MRFVFPNADERVARDRVLSSADEFMARAASSATELSRAHARACRDFFSEGFASLDARLDADVIDAPGPERVIALTARGDRSAQPLVDAICARAPSISPLRLSPGAPAQPRDAALARVQEELSLDVSDARVRAGFARGHLLELLIQSAAFAGAADDRAFDAAELLVASLLGESVFEDWVGEVRVAPLPRKSLLPVLDNADTEGRFFPLAELCEMAGTAIEGVIAGLPERTFCKRGRESEDGWTMFELEPELAHDYAAQDDLAIATTCAPEMLKCFLRGQPFSSLRFSRHAERFCYLKLDGEGQSSEARLAARRALEDRLSDALGRDGLGAVIGNGMGVRYAYVDLALANLEAAVERTVAVVREAGVPRRSWLLFCDGELAAEWVGVRDDTPPPL